MTEPEPIRLPFIQSVCRDIDQSHDVRIVARLRDDRAAVAVIRQLPEDEGIGLARSADALHGSGFDLHQQPLLAGLPPRILVLPQVFLRQRVDV